MYRGDHARLNPVPDVGTQLVPSVLPQQAPWLDIREGSQEACVYWGISCVVVSSDQCRSDCVFLRWQSRVIFNDVRMSVMWRAGEWQWPGLKHPSCVYWAGTLPTTQLPTPRIVSHTDSRVHVTCSIHSLVSWMAMFRAIRHTILIYLINYCHTCM